MWEPFYRLVTTAPAKTQPPLPHGHPYYVLIESLGSNQKTDGEHFESVLDECMSAGLLIDAVLAKSRAERDKLWAMRDDVEQLSRLAPIFTYDVSLPIPDMPGYVAEVRRGLEAKWKEPTLVVFGHLGDGNLHVIVGVGKGDLDDAARGRGHRLRSAAQVRRIGLGRARHRHREARLSVVEPDPSGDRGDARDQERARSAGHSQSWESDRGGRGGRDSRS